MIDFGKVKQTDPEIYDLIVDEYKRQEEGLEMIASENRPSEAVLLAQASYHTLKYAEGYPDARYYAGCRVIDKTEQLAIDRACKLFNCNYANVQPHSGASANLAVQFAFLKPNDKLMGMSLNSGGHLTHGAKPTFSGKNYEVIQYEVDKDTMEIDYDNLRSQIAFHTPRLFIAGASAYPRFIDFKRIRQIIDDVNEMIWEFYENYCMDEHRQVDVEKLRNLYNEKKIIFMVDMAHIAGLVATGLHQSPIPYADVVTTTTHKTLRGPRGGLILWNNSDYTKKINSAVFPGVQGGPLENIIAAKAVCFGEALKPEFTSYMQKVVDNTKQLAISLKRLGVDILTGGTDNHLLLIDLRKRNDITGQELERRLESVGIITNKNAVPFDTKNKKETSGLRIGTAAITSRGLGYEEIVAIAEIINDCLDEGIYNDYKDKMRMTIQEICKKFPLYQD